MTYETLQAEGQNIPGLLIYKLKLNRAEHADVLDLLLCLAFSCNWIFPLDYTLSHFKPHTSSPPGPLMSVLPPLHPLFSFWSHCSSDNLQSEYHLSIMILILQCSNCCSPSRSAAPITVPLPWTSCSAPVQSPSQHLKINAYSYWVFASWGPFLLHHSSWQPVENSSLDKSNCLLSWPHQTTTVIEAHDWQGLLTRVAQSLTWSEHSDKDHQTNVVLMRLTRWKKAAAASCRRRGRSLSWNLWLNAAEVVVVSWVCTAKRSRLLFKLSKYAGCKVLLRIVSK